MEKLFELVFKLIWLVEAQILQPWAVVADGRIGGHRFFKHVIIDAVDFEAEENERRVGVCQFLLHIAEKLHALRIGRVAVIIQARERGDAAHQFA